MVARDGGTRMSSGLMCLRCRRYIVALSQGPASQVCTCTAPEPSEDGKTPLAQQMDASEEIVWKPPSRWQQAAQNAFERAAKRYG
jgi:hypothetical protein